MIAGARMQVSRGQKSATAIIAIMIQSMLLSLIRYAAITHPLIESDGIANANTKTRTQTR
jgi:hypothetical protein